MNNLEAAYRQIGARIMDDAWWAWRKLCDDLVLHQIVKVTPDWATYIGDEEDYFGEWTEWDWTLCTYEEWVEEGDYIDPGEGDPNWGEGGVYLDESFRE